MTSHSEHKGFTLVELLVVVAMIAAIMGAMTVSVAGARERAKIEKARVEVKSIEQAILAYENYAKEGLPVLGTEREGAEANKANLGFLLEGSKDVPVLLQAALSAGGKVLDPWGTPYTIVIAKGKVGYQSMSNLSTGFSLPNINRLSEEERK